MKSYVLIIALLLSANVFVSAQKIRDIRKIDFTNYTHKIGKESVKFKDGLQEVSCLKNSDGIPSSDIWNLEKSAIKYGDLDGDGIDEAFMSLVANICGGNMITNEAVLVYKIENGNAVNLPEFDYFEEPCETGKVCEFSRSAGVSVSYDSKEKSIVVETFFATDEDAICCPSFQRQAWFKWNGAKFVETNKSAIEKVKTQEN